MPTELTKRSDQIARCAVGGADAAALVCPERERAAIAISELTVTITAIKAARRARGKGKGRMRIACYQWRGAGATRWPGAALGMQKAQRALANGDREGPLRYGSFVWPDYCVISRITGLSGTETEM